MKNGEFKGSELLPLLEAKGFEAFIEYTGGGCATFMLTKPDSNVRILLGPGSFNPDAQFTLDEFSVGRDFFNVDDTQLDEDPEEYAFAPTDSLEFVAEKTVEMWNKYN